MKDALQSDRSEAGARDAAEAPVPHHQQVRIGGLAEEDLCRVPGHGPGTRQRSSSARPPMRSLVVGHRGLGGVASACSDGSDCSASFMRPAPDDRPHPRSTESFPDGTLR